MISKQTWAAPERNKQPILDVLSRVLPARGTLLEIASGSGQHAAFFAAQLPGWTWQPSDVDDTNLASTRAWVNEAQLPNLRAPLKLDVLSGDWRLGDLAMLGDLAVVSELAMLDAVYCANMIHIAPWACCEGLIAGVDRHLKPGGHFLLYGPFRVDGAHTSDSNAAFDQSLKSRDARWGVRDVEAVVELASRVGVRLIERVAMPANNQTLVFQRDK